MARRRPILVAAVLGALLVLGAVLLLYTSLDSIVREAIERYGSELTGTRVRVSSVDISPRSGQGTLRGLRVANPEGFGGGDAFRLGEITVRIDVGTLTGDPIVVEEVKIEGPVVNYQLDPKGRSNVSVIQSHVEGYSSGSGGSEGAGEPGAPKRLRIRRFSFENGTVELDAEALGVDKRSTNLPSLKLSDLGGRSGAPPDVIGKQVLVAFGRRVTKSVAASGLERTIDEKLGGKAAEAAKGILRSIMD
jgi:hypothetical protein